MNQPTTTLEVQNHFHIMKAASLARLSSARLGMVFDTLHYFCTDDSEQEYALPFVLL